MSVNLLKNRNYNAPLNAFDGKVAAFAQFHASQHFITTNTDYVPALPSLTVPHALFLRADGRYGTDDPVLWPQQWTARYCHLPAIAKKGTRPELEIMWWDPTPADFVVKPGSVMRGLGRLSHVSASQFVEPINSLVNRCQQFRRSSAVPVSPLFGELIQNLLMGMEQLQCLPTTYPKMVFAVTSLQRAFLELDALYCYMTVYKPRIDDYTTASTMKTPVAQCVGAFTVEPSVAQQLWCARLPFWFIRPTYVFSEENILAVVPLKDPVFLQLESLGSGAPPVIYSGSSTTDKILAIQRAAAQTPWYRDPFENANPFPPASPLTPIASTSSASITSPSVVSVAATSDARGKTKQQRYKPYSLSETPTKARKLSQSPAKPQHDKSSAKPQRDKFAALGVPEMPPLINAWSEALANVDRSVSPFTSDPADRRYVLPEPALLVNTTPDRRRKFLHHWSMLSDGFMYMLSQPSHTQLLTAQEWRDVLEGLLTPRGHTDSKTYRRSSQLEDRIRPAMVACGFDSLEGFPAPFDSLRDFSLEQTREIVWEVAETNFRFEFLALDKRASKKTRLDDVKACFAGHTLIGVPLEMSKRGLAAIAVADRHRYLVRIANLMRDWTTKSPRPNLLDRPQWFASDTVQLEIVICRYYTQAFWEYFGRAAVVPMRLDHDLEKTER
ncbi:hypothetical protein DFH06DRAFT_1292190 [Mycena polygramma]|nr:hypothetical protein DFH06DRAFT_1080736 [Mycena polygramma]KAJ7676053.1 hypothetical protein DFH06DRAFT_1292190 [Mycena polygramma]